MAAILLSTNRDRVKLQEGGYLYVFDKLSTNGEKKFWRCERKSECNARIHTDAITNVVVKRASEHNHPSHLELTSSGAVLVGAKRRAYEPIDSIAHLEHLQKLNHLSSNEALQKLIQKVKVNINVGNGERQSQSPSSSSNQGVSSVNDDVSSSLDEHLAKQSESLRANTLFENSIGLLQRTIALKDDALNGVQDLFSAQNCSSSSSSSNPNASSKQQQNDGRIEIANMVANSRENSFNNSVASSLAASILSAVQRPKKIMSQINVIPIGVDKYLSGGFVCWSKQIASIVEDSELVAKMVSHSPNIASASILFTGASNTGKSCLAAIATKSVETNLVRLCSGEDIIALSEMAKITALRKVIEDTYSTAVNVVMLDNIDRIIDYCPVGQKYSNAVLQALLILLKKSPPPNHRLLIVATASDRCAEEFSLEEFFTSTFNIPQLSNVDHLMAVIEDSDVFAEIDHAILRNRLSQHSSGYTIGVKRLLELLELTKQRDQSSRVDFLCARLEQTLHL